jgi:fatty acid desaturase
MSIVAAPVSGADAGLSDYQVLARQVRAAGLLRPGRRRYVVRMAVIGVGLVCGWGALAFAGESWDLVAVAAFLAIASAQVVFVGHDAGHQQIFRSRRGNRLVGLAAGNVLTGLSFGWWVPKHNAHHAHPNQVDRDPDIGGGVIAFTPELANRRRGFSRTMAERQAWFFFPILLLEGIAMHVASIRDLARRRGREARTEAALLIAHTALYLGAVFWLLSPVHAIVFIAVQQGLLGVYLGCSFAPNHKGMELLEHDSDLPFLRRQVLTARNVTGGAFTTMALGGLNYQIEHHLFPTMPSANLPRSQAIVRAFCIERGLPYRECGLVESYRQALAHLQAVGAVVPAA